MQMVELEIRHISQEEADEYVLGLLDGDDATLVAEHTADCLDCQERLDDARDLTGQLALAVPTERAPARLKHRVFNEAGLSRQPTWRRVLRHARTAAAVAAVVLALGSLTGFFVLQSQVHDLQRDNDDLRAHLSQAIQGGNGGSNTGLLAALVSPGTVMAPIVSTGAGNGPAGRLVWNDGQHKCWLVFDKLDALPAGKTYQLWADSAGTYWSLGTFTTDETGVAQYAVDVSHDINDYTAAIVTVENAGGSESMTGPAVYRADLTDAVGSQ